MSGGSYADLPEPAPVAERTGRSHSYEVEVTWTGDLGEGTSSYERYSRDHVVRGTGKPELHGSSDPAFRGDVRRYNPEDLLVASLAACHMLWYLHLCADTGIVVTGYVDRARGRMTERSGGGGGSFDEVVLAPQVSLRSPADVVRATELHRKAHELCYIAASVNFPVLCHPRIEIEPSPAAAGGSHPKDAQT